MTNLWQKSKHYAEITPEKRNRYVDFLRALSIMAVVLGHWIIAAPYFADGKPMMGHILSLQPWTQWLTWLFQVMPIFFFVGGYSNYSSWKSALAKGEHYNDWLSNRLKRLLLPTLPLLVVWIVIALCATVMNVHHGFIQVGSQVAFVPTWFLAVYIIVVIFVPVTYHAWQKCKLSSAMILMAAACVIDVIYFTTSFKLLGWFNYLFIWLAIHQLGYAWENGYFKSSAKNLVLCFVSLTALVLMVKYGPYPLSLVGVPSDEISNTLPPKLPLLALGLAQIGLVMSLQKPANRFLSRITPWAATIVVNSMIMTLFLWHSTAMMLVFGLIYLISPELFMITPGGEIWWLQRIVLLFVFAIATLPFLLLFSRFERASNTEKQAVSVYRLYACCLLTSIGLGFLALNGIGGKEHWSVDFVALSLPFVGAILAGFYKRQPPIA